MYRSSSSSAERGCSDQLYWGGGGGSEPELQEVACSISIFELRSAPVVNIKFLEPFYFLCSVNAQFLRKTKGRQLMSHYYIERAPG